MEDQFLRTKILIGEEGINKLKKSKVAIFGIGGVGSFVAEALARAGVQSFILIDKDKVCESNINRQIIALHSTIGKSKVSVMRERILDINPSVTVEVYEEFFLPGSNLEIINNDLDYVVDCVDTVSAKIEIICQCKEKNIPVISSMGTGFKLNPSKFEIADIYKTSVCPLAKVMRRELKKREIKNVKVLYSKEEPSKMYMPADSEEKTIGSISFVPSVAGLMIAGEVIKDIISN